MPNGNSMVVKLYQADRGLAAALRQARIDELLLESDAQGFSTEEEYLLALAAWRELVRALDVS